MLCDDLEGWDGGWEGGPRGRGIGIHIADLLHCTAETSTTLESNFTPIKKKKDSERIQFCF